MKKYEVEVTYTISNVVEVLAESEEEAKKIASDGSQTGEFGSLDDWTPIEVITNIRN